MDIFCNNYKFNLKNTTISQIVNKYHVGKKIGDDFFLTPFETLYLYLKGKIFPEQDDGLAFLFSDILDDDIYTYLAYEILKNRGYYVNKAGNKFYYKKIKNEKYGPPIILKRETDKISFQDLYNEMPAIFITLDEEKSVTFYSGQIIDPHGTNINENLENINVNKAGNIHYIDSSVPTWLGEPFHNIRLLNEFETNFLINSVKSDGDILYQDLLHRNFIVKSGFKYGEHFRIYTKSMEEHAEYLVTFIGDEEWYKISRAIRLSISVRKKILFSGYYEGKLKYIEINRLKDI